MDIRLSLVSILAMLTMIGGCAENKADTAHKRESDRMAMKLADAERERDEARNQLTQGQAQIEAARMEVKKAQAELAAAQKNAQNAGDVKRQLYAAQA